NAAACWPMPPSAAAPRGTRWKPSRRRRHWPRSRRGCRRKAVPRRELEASQRRGQIAVLGVALRRRGAGAARERKEGDVSQTLQLVVARHLGLQRGQQVLDLVIAARLVAQREDLPFQPLERQLLGPRERHFRYRQ